MPEEPSKAELGCAGFLPWLVSISRSGCRIVGDTSFDGAEVSFSSSSPAVMSTLCWLSDGSCTLGHWYFAGLPQGSSQARFNDSDDDGRAVGFPISSSVLGDVDVDS